MEVACGVAIVTDGLTCNFWLTRAQPNDFFCLSGDHCKSIIDRRNLVVDGVHGSVLCSATKGKTYEKTS